MSRVFGEDRVWWASDFSWIEIRDFDLPSNCNRPTSDVLVILPDGYGYGASLSELYVDPALRVLREGRWQAIPHYFDAADGYAPTAAARQRNWRYLCLHAGDWRATDNVLTFLNQVTTFLSDPFRAWPTQHP